jgi:hypothetical protein
VFWVGTNVVGKEGLHVCMCIERNRGIPKNGVFWINVYIYIYIYRGVILTLTLHNNDTIPRHNGVEGKCWIYNTNTITVQQSLT